MDKPRLLIVENHPMQQAIYQALSGKYGFSMRLVTSCCDAVKAFQEEKQFSLILMDMGLSDIDGCACTTELRQLEVDGQHTPIVAVTGHTEEDYKSKCMSSGMDDFMGKPFSMDQFHQMLIRWTSQVPQTQA